MTLNVNVNLSSRRFLTAIGTTALGLGLLVGGATAIPAAFAQEATPAAEAPVPAEQAGDPAARLAQVYDSFVGALASELNADETAVDAAIRSALKQQVEERAAAGGRDAEQVAALQAEIDAAEAPLFLGLGGPGGFGGRGGMHGFDGQGGFDGRGGEHRGPRGGWDDRGPKSGFEDRGDDGATRETPEGIAPPATLPAEGDPSNQSAPTDAAPAERGVTF